MAAARKTFLGVILLALALATWLALELHFTPIDCTDGEGHGPDPDTRECLHSIAVRTERRPKIIAGTFLLVTSGGVVIAALLAGLHAARLNRRRIGGD